MNIEEIKSMKQVLDQNALVLGRRQLEAEERLNFGLACIEYGYQESFRRPEVLHEAAGALIDSMTHNRRDPRAPFALAYLFFLIDDLATAEEYLNIAVAIQADDPIILAFQETLHQEKISQSKKSLTKPAGALLNPTTPQNPSIVPDQAHLDFDQLYDQLNSNLVLILQNLSIQPPLIPASTALDYKELKANYKELCQQHQDFLDQLMVVEEEIDCDDLRHILKNFELVLDRHRKNLITSESILLLSQDLRAELTVLKQVHAEASQAKSREDVKILEENLEILLDNCDGYADRIDAFELQGITISLHTHLYNQLLALIEHLQEITDEKHEIMS
jgi:hypothetical protein